MELASEALFLMGRHGETFLNEAGEYRGWSNGPDAKLNATGKKQAKQAGIFIQHLPVKVTRIYCSDLDRSMHTAAIIGGILGIKVIRPDRRLRPLNVGELAGKKKSENQIDYWIHNPSVSFPGGESIEDFDRREAGWANDFLADVAEIDDHEEKYLVEAHVSNIVYWQNIHKKEDDYLDEKTDLVLPGGVVAVTEDMVVPLFRKNPKAA